MRLVFMGTLTAGGLEVRAADGRLEINGMYPGGPNQPFGGFGLIDPNQGAIYQQTNNSWSALNYTALEITITKNMSHGFVNNVERSHATHTMNITGSFIPAILENPVFRVGCPTVCI